MKLLTSQPFLLWLVRRIIFPSLCFSVAILLLNWNSQRPLQLDSTIHPIQQLHFDAQRAFNDGLAKQSQTLYAAKKEYRRRYKQEPPPGFDKWFNYAKRVNAPIIDNYDTIFNDLKPFRPFLRRGCDFDDSQNERLPWLVLTRACVKNGELDFDGVVHGFVLDPLREMTADFLDYLRDMCFEVNYYDEPRTVVKFADLQKAISSPKTAKEKMCVKQSFLDRDRVDIWSEVTRSCPPDSPARRRKSATKELRALEPQFVTDVEASTDICRFSHRPDHGFIRSPATAKIGKTIKPVLSPAKLSSFQDILFPSIYRWNSVRDYNETEDRPWDAKRSRLYWRGSTTGGMAQNSKWQRFHRQNFVDFVRSDEPIGLYNQSQETAEWSLRTGSMASIKGLVDVNFTAIIQCLQEVCVDQKKHYGLDYRRPAAKMWENKFVFDLDGNSYSGRYYDLLRSNSMVIKQALFREWHDERLVPWLHYVPLSMDMGELGEILRFFSREGDGIARHIAEAGKAWANRALRREDMQVYLFRLLLEMSRRDL